MGFASTMPAMGAGQPSGPGGPYTPRPDLGPGVGFGVGLPSPVDEFGNPIDQMTTQNTGLTPPVPGLPTDGGGGGKGISGMVPQLPGLPNAGTQFPNQQQPITQGNGQLPPGFGALSPIDRSQINPGASIGFGMPAQPSIYSRVGGQPNVDTRPGMPGYQGPGYGQPAPAPTNRFIPQNAPGVRPALAPQQQAQFGAAGQLGSARANLLAGRAPVSNAVASRMPARPAVQKPAPRPPVRRTK